MATPTELTRVIEYCEDRWPGTRNFRHVEKAAWDFAGIPAKALHEAAQRHFAAGERTAPTLSQLRAEGARIAAERGMTDPEASSCKIRGHHGVWAIIDIDKTDPEGNALREAECVDCGMTVIRRAHQLLTEGEKKEQQRAAAPSSKSAADDLADKIAP